MGNPAPFSAIRYPPLFPPVVTDREDTTKLTVRGLTPVARLAIPYGLTSTMGVTEPATMIGVESVLVGIVQLRDDGVLPAIIEQGLP